MNRIQKTFDRCGKEGKAAYVAYLTMGAPTLEKSFAAAETVVAAVSYTHLTLPTICSV